MTPDNPRSLRTNDENLVAQITEDGWDRTCPYWLFNSSIYDNGRVGFMVWSESPHNGVAYGILDVYRRYVPMWVARPGFESALIPLFYTLAGVIAPPFRLYLPDVAYEAMAVLKKGLPDFHVLKYKPGSKRITIGFDASIGPTGTPVDDGSGSFGPDDVAPVTTQPLPGRPSTAGVSPVPTAPRCL